MPFERAKCMLKRVADAGARDFVFAGGDPFIRRDIRLLVEVAKSLGLNVEIQTNCERIPPDIQDWIKQVDLFGLSLDGASPIVHDMMRMKKGNYSKVLKMADFLEKHQVNYIVRTVVSRPNFHNVVNIGALLRGRRNLIRWSLLEFSSIGEGARNADVYELQHREYLSIVEAARRAFSAEVDIDAYHGELKKRVYFLIRSDGEVYTTGVPQADGTYPTVGSIFEIEVSALLERLDVKFDAHENRYAHLMARPTA